LVSWQRVKKELISLTLAQETSWKELERGGVRKFTAVNFVGALQLRYERCKKCVKIAGSHLENN
jgi:hypothetical protein